MIFLWGNAGWSGRTCTPSYTHLARAEIWLHQQSTSKQSHPPNHPHEFHMGRVLRPARHKRLRLVPFPHLGPRHQAWGQSQTGG